jgi:hypothetical protein
VLNRLYIVVGVLLILLLTAAFLVPRFYDWSPYRARMEQIASDALGTDVRIQGELSFVLLPQPQMHMSKVQVGPLESPFIEIERVDAHLALMEFLRDQYNVQKLELRRPSLNLSIAEDGGFVLPIALASSSGRGNVAIENAHIDEGTILFSDQRADEHWRLENIKGDLTAAALRGPFSFEGNAELDDVRYNLRINSSDLNARGDIRLSSYIAPEDKSFSVASEGVLSTATLSPFYDGDVKIRVAPTNLAENEVRGDALFEGKLQADPTRVKFVEFSLQPDENRAGTRLSGAIDVRLGEQREFDAVISGGVVPLIPPDVLSSKQDNPYPLVSLLTTLPPPPALGNISGRLSIDISDLGLGDFSLRNVLVDAATDGEDWQIDEFSARLTGDTKLSLAGSLIAAQGRSAFDGQLTLETERLDALARGWRTFGERNPLFGAQAILNSNLQFSSSGATLSDAVFNLDGHEASFSLDWREEDERRLVVEANLGAFGEVASDRFISLLPDPNRPGAFPKSFPVGTFKIRAEQFYLKDVAASGVAIDGAWNKGVIEVERYAINEIAGTRLQGEGAIKNIDGQFQLSGKTRGDINANGDLAEIWSLLGVGDLHPAFQTIASASRPARLDIELTPADQSGQQNLFVGASSLGSSLNAKFDFSEGIWAAVSGPSTGEIDVIANSAEELAAQLGVSDLNVGSESATLSMQYQGTIGNSIDMSTNLRIGEDEIGFVGALIVSDLNNLRGSGDLKFKVEDNHVLAQPLGLSSFDQPALEGRAKIKFARLNDIQLSEIVARSYGEDVTGILTVQQLGQQKILSGDLKISRLEVGAFLQLLGGNASMLMNADNAWPVGPFNIADGMREGRGRIHVETPIILHNGRILLSDAAFDFTWTPTENRIRNLIGARGQGEVKTDITLCCYSAVPEKQLSGRFTLDGVDLSDLLPQAISSRISGEVSGSGQFSGVGADLMQVMSTMGGDGSFSVANIQIEDFDPDIFEKIAGVEGVLEMSPEELEALVLQQLSGQSLNAAEVEGLFRIAAGRVFVSNVAIPAEKSRLFGGANLDLQRFGLESTWALTPTETIGDGSVLSEANARVDAIIDGTLFEPNYRIDLRQMVDAIQVKAFEIEVDRLEKLRAEQEARAREQAEEQQRRMAEQAAQLAREEAAKAAAAAEEERKKREAAEQARQQSVSPSSNSVIELPALDENDQPIILLDPNDLFDPNAPFDPSATDADVPIDLIGGGN